MGTVFFNMLIGEKPCKGELLVAIVQQHLLVPVPNPATTTAICNFSEPDDVQKSEVPLSGDCLAVFWVICKY